ncbi:MAG: HlyD family efflux transporter periplasmic adaptor subunit [Alphaproteobacteria bacterium]|nr:HlyD family efflux transporter periplasmic adaptor subunit [Alphaproteobacteria bacterium]
MGQSEIKNIVHESETQRQYVRLPVPAKAKIVDAEFDIKDLSSGGLSVLKVGKPYEIGTIIPIELFLPFSAFSLEIVIDTEVKYYDLKEQTLGLQFVNVTQDQVALLNHVMKSFMAGEIVRSGDLLNVAARENFVTERKKNSTDKTPVVNVSRQIPGLLVITTLGIIAAAFIALNIYDSMFTLRTSNAVVKGAEIQVRAVSQGMFHSKIEASDREVSDRQEIGSVNGDDLKSPCECIISQVHRQDGEFVIPGDPILTLVPKESAPWIVATIKASDATKLSLKNVAHISIAGSPIEVKGYVASIKSVTNTVFDGSGSRMAEVRIIPEQNLDVDLSGRPAKVVFITR